MIHHLRISKKHLNLIQSELEASKPYEACGVMIGMVEGDTAFVERALPITNVRRTHRSFELDPEQYYRAWNDAEKNGMEIIGIYHTHPVSSAVPSLWDRETMENTPSVWLIAGSDGMRAYFWDNGIKYVILIEYDAENPRKSA